MRYEGPDLAENIDVVYHCLEKKPLFVQWVDTDKKTYQGIYSDAIQCARKMLVIRRVIFIDPMPTMPLPDVRDIIRRYKK